MCKLAFFINKGDLSKANALMWAQYGDLSREKDGVGSLAITNEFEPATFRDMVDYQGAFEFAEHETLKNPLLVGLHSRTGTCGSTDITNVHFFERDGLFFAHNGFVSELANYKSKQNSLGYDYKGVKTYGDGLDDINDVYAEINLCRGCASANDGVCKKHARQLDIILDAETKPKGKASTIKAESSPCDSLLFLEKTLEAKNKVGLDVDRLHKLVNYYRFTGMGLFVDTKDKAIYLLAHKVCYIINTPEFAGFFSYIPTKKLEIQEYSEDLGVQFEDGKRSESIDLPHKEILQGIYKLKF